MSFSDDPYALLGVAPDATLEAIQKAYHELARLYHPDFNPKDPEADDMMRRINVARDLLADSAARALYDRAHGHYERPRSPSYTARKAADIARWTRATPESFGAFVAGLFDPASTSVAQRRGARIASAVCAQSAEHAHAARDGCIKGLLLDATQASTMALWQTILAMAPHAITPDDLDQLARAMLARHTPTLLAKALCAALTLGLDEHPERASPITAASGLVLLRRAPEWPQTTFLIHRLLPRADLFTPSLFGRFLHGLCLRPLPRRGAALPLAFALHIARTHTACAQAINPAIDLVGHFPTWPAAHQLLDLCLEQASAKIHKESVRRLIQRAMQPQTHTARAGYSAALVKIFSAPDVPPLGSVAMPMLQWGSNEGWRTDVHAPLDAFLRKHSASIPGSLLNQFAQTIPAGRRKAARLARNNQTRILAAILHLAPHLRSSVQQTCARLFSACPRDPSAQLLHQKASRKLVNGS